MIFSSGQILVLVIIGGFFVFAIVNRICSCVEQSRISNAIANSYDKFLESKASKEDLDQSLEEFEKSKED